jgi:hypothetical protein
MAVLVAWNTRLLVERNRRTAAIREWHLRAADPATKLLMTTERAVHPDE